MALSFSFQGEPEFVGRQQKQTVRVTFDNGTIASRTATAQKFGMLQIKRFEACVPVGVPTAAAALVSSVTANAVAATGNATFTVLQSTSSSDTTLIESPNATDLSGLVVDVTAYGY